MKRVIITIPDNLTPSQELIAIAQQLGKKMLPSGQNELGTGYTVKHLETQIIIKREPIEKPIVTIECPICKTIVEKKIAKALYTNYGGNRKTSHYCSDECREVILQISGEGRASIRKSGLKPVYAY